MEGGGERNESADKNQGSVFKEGIDTDRQLVQEGPIEVKQFDLGFEPSSPKGDDAQANSAKDGKDSADNQQNTDEVFLDSLSTQDDVKKEKPPLKDRIFDEIDAFYEK